MSVSVCHVHVLMHVHLCVFVALVLMCVCLYCVLEAVTSNLAVQPLLEDIVLRAFPPILPAQQPLNFEPSPDEPLSEVQQVSVIKHFTTLI